MNKAKRQETILKIIENNIIVTQDDLQNALLNAGIEATQSTVSRDIKDLRIIKALDRNGTYRYINPAKEKGEKVVKPPYNHYADVFGHAVVSINSAMNDVVIKCYPGMASSVLLLITFLVMTFSVALQGMIQFSLLLVIPKRPLDLWQS